MRINDIFMIVLMVNACRNIDMLGLVVLACGMVYFATRLLQVKNGKKN